MSQDRATPFDSPHIVLVGNGEAHRHVAARCQRLTRAGARVTLVTRENFAFPDWLGGMLGGEWQRDDVMLDAASIERHGGEFVRASVSEIDSASRTLTLDDGRKLDYDWLSLDHPPLIDEQAIPGFYSVHAVHTGQVDSLWALRQALETALADPHDPLPSVAVLGGGPRGVEFAANLLALGERYGRRLPVTLVDSRRLPLPDAPRRANRWLIQRLARRGLRLELITSATRYENGCLVLDDASQVPADRLLVIDSERPPRLDGREGPKMTDVGETQTASAATDARLSRREDDAETGKDALSARVCAEGLLARLEAAPGTGGADGKAPHRSSHWQALNLGDLRDIAWRGSLWCRGRWVRRLKHRRDRREVARFLGR